MEKFENLNYGHLVLCPSTMDLNKWEEHIPTIINWIQSKKTIYYSISIEHEDTNRHMDIIIFSKSDINKNLLNNKGKQINLRGIEEQYVTNNLPNTQFIRKDQKACYWNYHNYTKDGKYTDPCKYLIGYNFKEKPKRNWNNLQLSTKDIADALIYYEENKTEKYKQIEDITVLNTKNATWQLLKYIEENKEKYKEDISELQVDTMKDRYCWIGLSRSVISKLFLQLKVMLNTADEHDKDMIKLDQVKEIPSDVSYLQVFKNRPKNQRLYQLYKEGYLKQNEIEKLLDSDIETIENDLKYN